MIDYTNEFEYAATRLDGTYCLLNGAIVFVHAVCGESGNAHIVYLEEDGRQVELQVDVTKLNVEPPQLGYVNRGHGELAYIMRKPMRRDWRQGMRDNNLINLLGGMIPIWELQHCVDDEYPDLAHCLDVNAAFTRDWAVVNGFLHHRTYHVGTASKENGITLFPENNHLIESLTEAVRK